MPERATFYYDLGSPYAYLSAERISGLFNEAGLEQPEWQPILLGGLFRQFDRGSWALTEARAEAARFAELSCIAAAQKLIQVRMDEQRADTLIAESIKDLGGKLN